MKKLQIALKQFININLTLINDKKNYLLIFYTMKKILIIKLKNTIIELYILLVKGNWKLYLNDNIIGNLKYENYINGKFINM